MLLILMLTLGRYTYVKLFYFSNFIMIGLRVQVYVYGSNFIDEKEKSVLHYNIYSVIKSQC